MKFGTVILSNVTKKKTVEKVFQNCSYKDDGVTNYVSFFKKTYEKWLKYILF